MRLSISLGVACALSMQATPAETATRAATDATEGRLVTTRGKETVDVPLEHTEVAIRIDGHLADASLTQTFRNPYPDKIEAVYLFPLPTNAAVNAMTIETGGRIIEGRLRERDDARRTYERARRKGHVAALLTQERPNLFTQAVANIEPGATVKVTLRYVQSLTYEDGGYELVFPMVAGSRYVPTGAGTGDALVQKSLPAGQRSSHDIGLTLEVDAGVPISSIASPSHRIELERASPSRASLHLAAGGTIPNKDFVLRYRVAGAQPAFAAHTHRGADGQGAFFLVVQPPVSDAPIAPTPREIVFLLDTSSSMAGEPLAKAKEVVRRVLGGLRPDDTFQIVRFDDAASALGPRAIANKPRNVGYVLDWLDALDAAGGTEMTTGIEAALAVPNDPARLRLVVFLTDGYVGNEDEILALVGDRLGASRLFSFGVGSAVNRYLLEEMAALGRGDAQVVSPAEDTAAAVERFYRRIDRPVLTDISIDWHGLPVSDVVPAAIPDLFAGQPIVLAGHYGAAGGGTVTVRGVQGGRPVSFEVPVTLPERADHPAVASVWARARIRELSRGLVRQIDPTARTATVRQITDLALTHRLMSRYTAFVAVDSAEVTAGGAARRVKVPVEVPAHMRSIPSGASGGGIATGSYGSIGYGSGGGVAMPMMAKRSYDAPAVRMGTATAVGDLDKNLIKRYIRQQTARVRYCYEKQLQTNPTLGGKVTVKFTIGADGKVVDVTATGMNNPALESCVADVIRSIRFPATNSGKVVISYPFVFQPGKVN